MGHFFPHYTAPEFHALALPFPFSQHRVWVNDQVAALRFESLKNAVLPDE
jgi:hypothetical protein